MGGGFRLHLGYEYTMNRSELPELYRNLVDLRRKQAQLFPDPEEEEIQKGFIWCQTPEDDYFWRLCCYARTVANLPPIPESSIQELLDLIIIETLQSPMNTDTIRNDNGQALHPEFQTLAQHNRKEQGPCRYEGVDTNELVFAFTWVNTEQGRNFWHRVNCNESTDADLALAIESNRNTTTTHPTPEPKKHSTMDDVFAGMNRHAKKENNQKSDQEIKKRTKIHETTISEHKNSLIESLIDHFDAME